MPTSILQQIMVHQKIMRASTALETKQCDPEKTSVSSSPKKNWPWNVIRIYKLWWSKSKLPASRPQHLVLLIVYTAAYTTFFYLASSSRLRNPVVRSSYSFWNFPIRTSSPSAGSSNFWDLFHTGGEMYELWVLLAKYSSRKQSNVNKYQFEHELKYLHKAVK